ncbi:IPT/TIG domain-containing protein [Streptomyces sp. 3N207]|uniref:IPT/TIG domain-containing protein n=1 Tax=Streptomyces sp. 3N207 TaxID=3457417 RepID=UPI003FD553EB
MLPNIGSHPVLNAAGQNPFWPFPPLPPQPPVLLAAVPTSGPTTGGNTVLLIGMGLNNITSVSFGGNPAIVLSQDFLGLLAAVSAPAHAAGTVPVTVTTAAGTSNVVNYTYQGPVLPPTVSAISPTSGPVAGGTPFTITGANLAGATVLFGGVPAVGVTVDPTGNSLTGVTPPGLGAGNVTVTVISPAGTANVPGGFTYDAVAPTAATITPNSGPAAGGTPFVIAGTGLQGGSVTIGGSPATGVTVDPTGTLLFGTTPAGAVGNQPVVVTTSGGSATVPGGFNYA